MTETDPAATTEAPAAATPGPLKAKAMQLGLKAYLKLPPKAQQQTIQAVMKAQPVIARLAPHKARLASGFATFLAVRSLRARRRRG